MKAQFVVAVWLMLSHNALTQIQSVFNDLADADAILETVVDETESVGSVWLLAKHVLVSCSLHFTDLSFV